MSRLRSRLPRRSAVAAERDVEVVAQPGRQADVPVAPELLRRAHEVREAEVLDQLDAHQLRGAARDVRVAGEVAVDLERERVDAEQHVDAGVRRRRIEDRCWPGRPGCRRRTPSGKAPGDQPRAVAHLLARDRPRRVDLRQQADARRIGPATRCGKYATNTAKSSRSRVGGNLAPVDVDDVAHRHERVERDADRQQHAQRHEVELPAERAEERRAGCRRRS